MRALRVDLSYRLIHSDLPAAALVECGRMDSGIRKADMATQFKSRPDSLGVTNALDSHYDRDALQRLLATRTFKRGRFTLASGRTSAIYFNVKTTMMHPHGAALCARGLLELLSDMKVDYIGGLEMGAVPLLSVVAAFSAEDDRPIPSFFVRKAPKPHGTQALIEGMDDTGDGANETLQGKTVVLIDDVATSGMSILKAVDQIEAAGGSMSAAIVILDREEGASQALAARGIRLHALFTATDLGVTAADRTAIE
jgi:orotate phosphoribosyltransferase